MAVKSLMTNLVDERREKLALRIAEAMEKKKQNGICPKILTCNYVTDNIKAVNMSISEAEVYISIVCEQYSNVCGLNLGE